MRALAILLVLAGCAGSPPRPADPGPGEALGRFLGAVDRNDMEGAYRLLTGRWRARMTPERLARDLRLGGDAAQERIRRARLAAREEPVLEGDVAAFPIGDGHSVRLHREAGGWKVDALE